MKKGIAILIAFALITMAFAQKVNAENELYTEPRINVGGGRAAWQWTDNIMLRNRLIANGETADGRGKFFGRVETRLMIVDPNGNGLLNVLPRIGIATPVAHMAGTYRITDYLAFGMGSNFLHKKAGAYTSGCGDIYWAEDSDFGCAGGLFAASKNYAHVQTKGIFAALLGDGIGLDGFTAVLGFNNDWFNKNMASFCVGAKYKLDLFGISARWHGTFGDEYTRADIVPAAFAASGSADRKSDYNHEFYVGANFSGLKDLPVGIELGAGFLAKLSKAGSVTNSNFAVSAQSEFDFRNGIKDAVWLTLGFGKFNNETAKILPFGIGNKLSYEIGGDYDASFGFDVAYMQDYLTSDLKSAKTTGASSMDIYVSPVFSWTMGKSSFEIALRNDIKGHLEYTEKNNNDWAFTRVFGDEVLVCIPITWTYKF